MPQVIRELPFVRYVININGAAVTDLQTGETLCRTEIPKERALAIYEYLRRYPVIYDAWIENKAWMTAAQMSLIDRHIPAGAYRDMFHDLRQPVGDLPLFVQGQPRDVQKISVVPATPELRLQLLRQLQQDFPDMMVTSSVPCNIEINCRQANKGEALLALAARLGYGKENTMAFGDGLNDLTMVQAAGVGVAMANAEQSLKDAADWITASNDEDGVARGIEKFCFTDF
jgi:Cof subfamily protein (haloacid dehalogenase superfamily)